jgi:NADH-quinone oxidoreductase subunit A
VGATCLPMLFAMIVAVAFSLAFAGASVLFGPRRPLRTKLSVYECGMPPVGDTRQRFSVKFYLVAVLFILFDLEAVFLFPWAITFRRFAEAGGGWVMLGEGALFLGVLFTGWLYLVKRGALDWD